VTRLFVFQGNITCSFHPWAISQWFVNLPLQRKRKGQNHEKISTYLLVGGFGLIVRQLPQVIGGAKYQVCYAWWKRAVFRGNQGS
jgi:hypothetical protein